MDKRKGEEVKDIEYNDVVLPDNPELAGKLRAKFSEYQRRCQKTQEEYHAIQKTVIDEPEKLKKVYDTNFYKLELLRMLLEKGRIEIDATIVDLTDKFGTFDERRFYKALRVIEDYCKTGGANLVGGELK